MRSIIIIFFFWEYHPLWVMMPCHITAQRPTASQPCWDLRLFLSAPSFLLLHLGTTANSCPQLGEVQDTDMPLSLISKTSIKKNKDSEFPHGQSLCPSRYQKSPCLRRALPFRTLNEEVGQLVHFRLREAVASAGTELRCLQLILNRQVDRRALGMP